MIKEQVINLAMQAIAKAYEKKDEIKKKLMENETIGNYLKSVKDVASYIIEQNIAKKPKAKRKYTKRADKVQKQAQPEVSKPTRAKKAKAKVIAEPSVVPKVKKIRKAKKSSIKPIHEIPSVKADAILSMLKEKNVQLINKNDEISGKKSLACLVWSLGHAEEAKIKEGISIHDVSSLVYKAAGVELYPINISRTLKANLNLINQVNTDKKNKTYLLSDEGKKFFKENFRSKKQN